MRLRNCGGMGTCDGVSPLPLSYIAYMSDLNQILEDVRKLSPEDQRQVLAELGSKPVPLLSEGEFVLRLQELGVLHAPELPALASRVTPFQPAQTVGQPASE